MKRREFLLRSSLATVGGLLIPDFVKAYERHTLGRACPVGRRLVMVQFSGGNDGLNTIVPYRNDIYYRQRPKLALPAGQVLPLTDAYGLHPALEPLRKWHDAGQFAVLNAVGYPNPDRSHFRSMDIWQTASRADEYLTSGWLGRYLDATCNGTGQPHRVLEIDDQLSLALKGERLKGMAVTNPGQLYRETRQPFYRQLAEANRQEYQSVEYLYKTLAETVSSAGYLHQKTNPKSTGVSYPATALGSRFRTMAQLMQAGVETSVFYVSHGSFDTHVNQQPRQAQLLKQYAEALDAFLSDLKNMNLLQETLVMTFSEFGRRVQQNASNGTDHGTAGCVLLAGGGVQPPVGLSALPDLTDLDDGDLRFRTDFRQVYATLLEKWLEVPAAPVLGPGFAPLQLF